MSTVIIRPKTLAGTVAPPPSKSQAHRLIISAALARGTSTIRNVAFSQDIEATLRCMEALGASWEQPEEGVIRVTGIGGTVPRGPAGEELPAFDCGESGSTLRFLIPIALAAAGGGRFTGRGRLMERPQKPYLDLFAEKGIFYRQKDGVLTVRGRLEPGEYRLPGNVSSQFFTGLLFALPLLDGTSTIAPTTEVESWDYILMTMDALMGAGVAVIEPRENRNCFSITPSAYAPFDRTVEADWSQAGFWYGARVLGNPVEVTGLNEESAQGDRVVAAYSARLAQPGDVDIDVSQCPDLVPPLAVMAAVRQGTTRILNAARLRIKESDRLASVTATLNALGAQVEEHPDSLTIHGLERLAGGADIDCCNDHRIAMMAAIAATRCEQPVTLLGAHCVKKSYPNFWEHYRMLGGDLDVLVSG
ncbi:3-phosphoshikimate 1-carboxyvinyltransferase [Pseudoflavonifractor phocaeensis]|uniref:3-phosphoshikimate 1-carboxyvinyltransferase n=1 Tax=Pseudoflavonifractor phocaeensis TaxID=1870988 RepID=UPI001F486B8D|nr:3-phosphoshikimate 1-carboxyvinyltransferase [Pseudoflavonifractor phocaeensis]MCF2661320.1 3-phosphoshikimate 1-carboxyvinyltransferase [Pseudoflavonifractor phocaeensis]